MAWVNLGNQIYLNVNHLITIDIVPRDSGDYELVATTTVGRTIYMQTCKTKDEAIKRVAEIVRITGHVCRKI